MSVVLEDIVAILDEEQKPSISASIDIEYEGQNFYTKPRFRYSSERTDIEDFFEFDSTVFETPFTEWENKQKNDFENILDIVGASALPFKEKIINRLRSLNESLIKEGECSRINLLSIEYFLSFFKSLNGIVNYPTIIVSAANNVRVQWRKDKNLFAVEFLPGGDVKFVLFKRYKKYPAKIERTSGLLVNEGLKDYILNNNIDWIYYERRMDTSK